MTENLRQIGVRVAITTPTPFYLLDLDQIRESFLSLDRAWRARFPNFRSAYSYKTNPLRAVAEMLHRLGAAAEVTSGTELRWALEDGFSPDEILFDGPVKNDEELVAALVTGVRIQVDSLDEVDAIVRLGHRGDSAPRLSARLAVSREGLVPSRFGLTGPEFVVAMGKLASAGYSLSGVHLHVGSNLSSALGHGEAVRQAVPLLRHLLRRCESPVLLDVGGGFPAWSLGPDSMPTPAADFAGAVAEALSAGGVRPIDIEIVAEPGRCLVEDAGILLTRVVVRKVRGGRRLAVVDAGSNLVRSVRSWHHPVHFYPAPEPGFAVPYDMFGSLCFESDQLASGVPGPEDLAIGTLVVIGSSGGYDIPSANVWTRPSPPVLGTRGGEVVELRRAQRSGEIRELHRPLGEEAVPTPGTVTA